MHALPPPLILSQPMHGLPLFYPSPCTPSPYSIPAHACPSPILSLPMHTLSLFYFTPCMLYHYSIPPYACHLSILSHPMHAFFLFSQPMLVLQTPCHIHLEGIFLLCHLSMPLLNLLTLSISSIIII